MHVQLDLQTHVQLDASPWKKYMYRPQGSHECSLFEFVCYLRKSSNRNNVRFADTLVITHPIMVRVREDARHTALISYSTRIDTGGSCMDV